MQGWEIALIVLGCLLAVVLAFVFAYCYGVHSIKSLYPGVENIEIRALCDAYAKSNFKVKMMPRNMQHRYQLAMYRCNERRELEKCRRSMETILDDESVDIV